MTLWHWTLSRVTFGFVQRKTSATEEPRRHFPPCPFTLNASSCSLALGHSITKYCFSTCCTKSFQKAAGRHARGLTIRALFPLSGLPPKCYVKWKWPKSPDPLLSLRLWLSPHLEKETGRDLDVASKRLSSRIKSDVEMLLKESKSQPRNREGETSMSTREALGRVNHALGPWGCSFKARLCFHYIVAVRIINELTATPKLGRETL